MILMLCLFSITAGVIAFDGKLNITQGSESFIDTTATTNTMDSNQVIKQGIQDYSDTSNYSITQTTQEVSPETDSAKSFWDFLTGNFINGLVGYWGIIDKIFFAFPELGTVLKVVLVFFQVMGLAYVGSVLAALLRGGYNPG